MHIASMRATFVLLLVLFLSNVHVIGHAATIQVPADQPTIQTAINAAAPTGDVIVVAPGTYLENLDYNGKALTVQSAQGPAVTTINGLALSVVQFHTGEGRGSVLQGFTITNGSTPDYGGGIFVSSASPTITGNIIQGNWAGAGGGGIAVLQGAPLITNNIIRRNGQGGGFSGGTGGGGILVQWTSGAEISFNTITNNTWSEGGGLALFSAGSPIIRQNLITDNSVTGCSPECFGGGLSIVNSTTAHIVGNLITRNSAGGGSGVYNSVPSGSPGSRFINNTIVFNVASGIERASDVMNSGFYAQSQFVNNVIGANNGGIAFYCDSGWSTTPPIMQNNDIFATNALAFGGVCSLSPSNLSVDPQFANMTTGDYHLTFGSPVIDNGLNTDPDLTATDVDQNPRLVDGNGDGVATIDLGAYELQNPLPATGDSSLIQATPNTNEGSNPLLYLGAGQHTVVSFNITGLPTGKLTHATLQLTLAQPAANWGPHGNGVAVYNLPSTTFTEGNGFATGAGAPNPGSGAGTTWTCPTDSNISNQLADCAMQWNGANAVIGKPTATITVVTGQTGVVQWDVTADVLSAIASNQTTVQWMIRRAAENKQGQAVFSSKEAATAAQTPGIGPGLKLQF